MGKYETKYNPEWEKSCSWLKKVANNVYAATCTICQATIQVKNGGKSQVQTHANTKKHKELAAVANNKTSQSTLVATAGGVQLNKSRLHLLSMNDEILRAEILWALKCVKSNFSFACNVGNNNLFSSMFPDSTIAKSYKMSETKCKYLVQFGICPWILEDLKDDLKEKPFSFAFDETTTSQVKKQYDGYVRFESGRHGIVDRYCGSLFLGHCDANQLVTNFCDFGKQMDWTIDYLLQIMMDGPRTNLSFQKKLTAYLNDINGKSVISVGTCTLHKFNNGYKKSLKKLSFDFDGFATDLHFFFKLSSGRRYDYRLVELITDINTEFMLKHGSSRWLYLKKSLNRILSQWENLREYFLKFLPKEANFAKDVESTDRYQRIRKVLVSNTSKLYMSFAVYIADMLETFIIRFQCSKPMVHVLYPAMGEILFKLMSNFVKPNCLKFNDQPKDAHQLGVLDLTKSENQLSIHKIDFGSKTLYQIGLIESKTNLDCIKTELKMAYLELTAYLQESLPHDSRILKNLQYIHPKKVRHPNAVPAVRELAPTIAKTLRGSNFTALSIESFTDVVVQQFKLLQAESNDEMEKLTSVSYWNDVSNIINVHNEPKYAEIARMSKAFMCLSHGNATPERGFSENKAVLDHRESLDEGTIVAIRITKDFLRYFIDLSQFEVSRRLLTLCRSARAKYSAFLELQKSEDNSRKLMYRIFPPSWRFESH